MATTENNKGNWWETPTDPANMQLDTLFDAMDDFFSFAGPEYPVKTLASLIDTLAYRMHEADEYDKETVIEIQSLARIITFISNVGQVHNRINHLSIINNLSTSAKS